MGVPIKLYLQRQAAGRAPLALWPRLVRSCSDVTPPLTCFFDGGVNRGQETIKLVGPGEDLVELTKIEELWNPGKRAGF